MIIKAQNNLAVNAPRTYLTNLEVSGTNVLRWKNPNSAAASWAVQVGATGEEQSEIVLLNTATPAGTAGTLTANTLYEHPADTPLFFIKYDQVVFERSTSGTAGTATAMTNGTITYQADQAFTQFDDTSGSSTYAYKTLFRSSVLAVNSTESDWITSAGFTFYSLAKIRQRGLDKLVNSSYLPDTSIVDDWINEWKDEMSNAVISVNEDYAMGTVDVGFGTAGLGTITTADFVTPRRIDITYDSSTFYQSTKIYSKNYLPGQVFSATHPYHYWVGDTVLGVKPEQSGGTARITFYRFGTTMVNDTDLLPLPMRPFTKSFVDYVEAQALRKDSKPEWQAKLLEAQGGKQDFVNKIVPRDQTGPDYIKVTEAITGEDYFIP